MVRPHMVLNSWKTVRSDTAQAVEDLPAGEQDFKPAADIAAFGEIARHILDAGRALTGMLKEHERTHRQQLFMYLRLKGIVPATTRRRQAAQQKA